MYDDFSYVHADVKCKIDIGQYFVFIVAYRFYRFRKLLAAKKNRAEIA